MVVACKPIIPVGVLTNKNRPTAIDFDVLTSSFENPILRYDNKQIRLLTVLTNALLEIAHKSYEKPEITFVRNQNNVIVGTVNDSGVVSDSSGNTIGNVVENSNEVIGPSGNVIGTVDSTPTDITEVSNDFSNNILDTQYPALSDRLENQGPLTEEEVAEIIEDSGLTPDYVQETYENEFPTEINIPAINEAINEIKDAIQESLDQIREDNQTSSIPIPSADSSPFDNPFASSQTNIPIEPLLNWTPGNAISNVLGQMNSYFKPSYTNSFRKSNECAAIPNPFSKLASLVASVSSSVSEAASAGQQIMSFATKLLELVSDTITRIFNFPEYIPQMAALSANLEKMKQDLMSMANSVINDMKTKIENLKNSASAIVGEPGMPKAARRLVSKKIRQVENFLSDLNVNRIKAKINAILKVNEEQFEDLLPDVLRTLSLKVCGVTNFLEGIFKKPNEMLNKLLNDLSINKNILENYSVLKTNRIIDAGGVRLGIADRNAQRTNHANQANQAEGNSFDDLIPPKYVQLEMSAEENAFVNSLTADYSDLFVFNDQWVKKMGPRARKHWEASGKDSIYFEDGDNQDNSGWNVVAERHAYVYAALARISKRLRNDGLLSGPLQINSAFRSKYYNRYVSDPPGSRTSRHMHGMALDIGDINSGLTTEGSARFIDYASEEGFTTLGIYPRFIHIDIGSAGPSVFKLVRTDGLILDAVDRHKKRRSRA